MVGVVIVVVNGDNGGDTWEYDEYRAIDGVTAADGALELVTIGGVEYVHAKDIGGGSFTTPAGTEQVEVVKANIDLFVIAGQSNTYASIYMDPSAVDPVPLPGVGYYYGTASAPVYSKTYDPADCSSVDMVDNDGDCRIGSWWPALSSEYYEKTGHRTYFIDVGLSGQPIATFLPGASNWAHVHDTIGYGLAAIDANKFNYTAQGYIWVQGEGDRNTPIATYELDFITINQQMNDGTFGVEIPRAYISKVRAAFAPTVSTAQTWLTENVQDVLMGSTLPDTFTVDNGLMVEDDLHYSQAGCNALGESLADTIAATIPQDNDNITDAAADLLGIVPIIVVISLILGAVVLIVRREEIL